MPTDENRRPIHPVHGTDGRPLPTDETGHPLGADGKAIPTDASGTPIDKDGQPLPTDSSGNYVMVPSEEAVVKELPTDESGNVLYPITMPDGSPMPTDSSGNYITDEGVIVEKDEEGRPLGPDGQVLPTDQSGNYIYPVLGPDGSPLPTDENRRPIRPVFGTDGRPLPTDDTGHPLGKDGRPIPTDTSGKPIDKDGQPLPTDSSGHYVIVPAEEGVTKELPTDESGNIIYPVTRPDGSPLPTDASGNYITEEGIIVGPDGKALPVPHDERCSLKNLKMDIVFTIDTRKLSNSTFQNILRAISSFADRVDLSPDVTRIGVVYGNKDIVVPLPLGGYQEKEHMRDELRRIVFSYDDSDDRVPLHGSTKQQFTMFPRPDSAKISIIFGGDIAR
ncbi:unnamed protein product [Cylicostephanus goldi]|uniref:VWFA domain-containing protein n=1 Tax=Cylicostephanus goldi TaxID=71465 RepID=A0A3P6R692_CYLGO|nr:unnamed protein product [Cylicostephanus goldi]